MIEFKKTSERERGFLHTSCTIGDKKYVCKVDLFSRQWCNLIFEGRNQDYGAYRIRSEAGKRYCIALVLFFMVLLTGVLMPLTLGWLFRYRMMQTLNEVRVELQKLEPAKVVEGHEIKHVAVAARPRPRLESIKGALPTAPEIVEVTKEDIRIGFDGPEQTASDDELWAELAELDTFQRDDALETLPEGLQLQTTDVVEELPQFPGGPAELMKWLDRHIVYPKSCLNAGIGGVLHLSFYVDSDGSVRGPWVAKPLHPILDRIAMNAMRHMPKWQPGKSNGVPVMVCVTVPIHFHPQQKT